jgi:hypothetical protein
MQRPRRYRGGIYPKRRFGSGKSRRGNRNVPMIESDEGSDIMEASLTGRVASGMLLVPTVG